MFWILVKRRHLTRLESISECAAIGGKEELGEEVADSLTKKKKTTDIIQVCYKAFTDRQWMSEQLQRHSFSNMGRRKMTRSFGQFRQILSKSPNVQW